MKSKLQIEVEPISEARWSKIETGLFEQLDRDAREGRIEARPAAAAPVSFFKRRAVVMGAVGFAAAAAFAAVAGRNLFEGGQSASIQASRIVTGTSPSHVALGTSSLEVAPESAVVASGDDKQGLLVVLEKGSVDCEVAPRKGRPPFVVLAGDVRVRVVGTRFVVARAPEGVTVRVDHGAVEVARGGETRVLHDGEAWSEAKTVEAPKPPPSAAPTEEPQAPVPGVSRPTTPHAAPTARDPNTDQKAFERAASLEVRDPDAALSTYRRLGAGSGAWAAPSLFAAGRLAADRGRSAEARTLLSEYLRRFPSGPNAGDARKLLSELR